MKKFFKKLNIARSPLLRIICVLCAVVTCVMPFAVSASAVTDSNIGSSSVVYQNDFESISSLSSSTSSTGQLYHVLNYGGGVCEIVNHGRSGSKSLKLTASYSEVKNTTATGFVSINLDSADFVPGSTYRVSAWFRSSRPNSLASITVQDSPTDFITKSFRWYDFGTNWVYKEAEFVMPDDVTGVMRFRFGSGAYGMLEDDCLFVDDISISKVDGPNDFEVVSIWDFPFTSTVNGDTNTVKVDFPLDSVESYLFVNDVKQADKYGNPVGIPITASNTSYRAEFFPLGVNTVFDSRDFPSDTQVFINTQIDGSGVGSNYDNQGPMVSVGYQTFDSNMNTLSFDNSITDGTKDEYVNNLVSTQVSLNIPANTYGVRFKSFVHFTSDSSILPGLGVNFELSSFSISFTVADLWVQATQNNKLNGVLDDVKTELQKQGTTLNQVLKEQGITNDKLDDVLGEQEETNDKLDNIINGTVDSTLPPDSGTVDEFHKQEEEIMGSVNDGFNTALGMLENTILSIMEVLAGFHAISYIFNLFYGLPLIQLVVNFSLVLGLFGAMLGVANMVGNKFIGKVGGKGKD